MLGSKAKILRGSFKDVAEFGFGEGYGFGLGVGYGYGYGIGGIIELAGYKGPPVTLTTAASAFESRSFLLAYLNRSWNALRRFLAS